VDKIGSVVFSVVVAVVLWSVQAGGQVELAELPGNSLVGLKSPAAGKVQTCSQPEKLIVPREVAKRARIKARLVDVLHDSLLDDTKGVVNLAREKEIKDLVDQLTKEKAY
jgi:hypothetical protein